MRTVSYSLLVALNALLLSFLVLVAIGPLFASAERWTLVAFAWLFPGMLLLLLGAAVSAVVRSRYVRESTHRRAGLFIANVVTVAALPYLALVVS